MFFCEEKENAFLTTKARRLEGIAKSRTVNEFGFFVPLCLCGEKCFALPDHSFDAVFDQFHVEVDE